MQNKRLLCFAALFALLLTVCRVMLLPRAAGDGTGLTHISWPLLLAMAVTVGVLFLLGRAGAPYRPPMGDGTRVTALGGMAFGAILLIASAGDLLSWVKRGVLPPPRELPVNDIDLFMFLLSSLAGLCGGAFLLFQFARWLLRWPDAPFSRRAALPVAAGGVLCGVVTIAVAVLTPLNNRLFTLLLLVGGALMIAFSIVWFLRGVFATGWFWLLPVVWGCARLVRYNVVYAMSVDISPAVYEYVLYAVAVAFLLSLARYVAGVGTPTRHLRGLSASTAALALAASLSRVVLAASGKSVAAAYCPIPHAVELMLGFFALAVVPMLTAENEAWGYPSARHYR